MTYPWRVDSFTSLDDLPKKHHGDPDAALAFIRDHGITRVSVWDMTPALGRSFGALFHAGKLRTDIKEVGFPWIAVHLTPDSDNQP